MIHLGFAFRILYNCEKMIFIPPFQYLKLILSHCIDKFQEPYKNDKKVVFFYLVLKNNYYHTVKYNTRHYFEKTFSILNNYMHS